MSGIRARSTEIVSLILLRSLILNVGWPGEALTTSRPVAVSNLLFQFVPHQARGGWDVAAVMTGGDSSHVLQGAQAAFLVANAAGDQPAAFFEHGREIG
jgi:hypothetical protein